MFESKDTDMWAGGNSEFSFHPSEEGLTMLQSARSTLEGYYRKARLWTKLIPCAFLAFPLAIIFTLLLPNLIGFVIVIPFVCIGGSIIGLTLLQSKTRKHVKDNYVKPVLDGCFDGPAQYDGTKHFKSNQNRTALDANDVQSIVEYFQIAFEKWSHCTVSDTIAARIYGRDFLFGDVDLWMQGKNVVHAFRGQVFVYTTQRTVAGEHIVGFDARTGVLVACPFVRKPADTSILRTIYFDYEIQREIGENVPREDLAAISGAVDLDAFAKAMNELRDVAQAPFVVFFSGNHMVLVVHSNRDILEPGTGKRRERPSELTQHDNSISKLANEEKSIGESIKNTVNQMAKAEAMMFQPNFLMVLFSFGPIDEIEGTCHDDCEWIARMAGILAKVC